MKVLLATVVASLVFVVSCSTHRQVGAFQFSDSHGNVYLSESAAQDLAERYNLPSDLSIVVIATDSLTSDEFARQLAALESMDTESAGLLYIVASTKPMKKYGYRTDTETAKELLNGESFRVIGLSSDGRARWVKLAPVSERFIKSSVQ